MLFTACYYWCCSSTRTVSGWCSQMSDSQGMIVKKESVYVYMCCEVMRGWRAGEMRDRGEQKGKASSKERKEEAEIKEQNETRDWWKKKVEPRTRTRTGRRRKRRRKKEKASSCSPPYSVFARSVFLLFFLWFDSESWSRDPGVKDGVADHRPWDSIIIIREKSLLRQNNKFSCSLFSLFFSLLWILPSDFCLPYHWLVSVINPRPLLSLLPSFQTRESPVLLSESR